jgi:hypothetical protein
MNALKAWIASAVVLLAGAVAAGDDTLLESLDPATALADVRASRGVVFVDLYADW